MGIQYTGAIMLPQGGFTVKRAVPAIVSPLSFLLAHDSLTDLSPYAHTLTPSAQGVGVNPTSKFGGSSIYSDLGNLEIPHHETFEMAPTDHFTYEIIFRPNGATSNYHTLFAIGEMEMSFQLDYRESNPTRTKIYFSMGDGSTMTPTINDGFLYNDWNHVVVCRDDSGVFCVINGQRAGLWANAFDYGNPGHASFICTNADGNNQFNGWIDGLRVVKGQAMYGYVNIPMPTERFPTDGY